MDATSCGATSSGVGDEWEEIEGPSQLESLLRRKHSAAAARRTTLSRLRIVSRVRLPEAWPTLPSLTHLEFSMDMLGGDDGCVQLAAVLARGALPQLAHLQLKWNWIGEAGCGSLAEALERRACPRLAHLSIACNELEDAGCVCLAKALENRACPRLSHLNLAYNLIGEVGATRLAEALERRACPFLAHLDLSGNPIGEAGSRRLAEALGGPCCPYLAHLDVGCIHIGDEGAARLLRSLRACPALSSLILCDVSLSALPDDLGCLPRLSTLDVSDNHIRTIQPALYDLFVQQLEAFDAGNNPLEGPPVEVVQRGLDALKDYLRELRDSGRQRPFPTARVVLLGDTEHGKTTLCRSLVANRPCRDVGRKDRTHALEIHDWDPGVEIADSAGRQGLSIEVWDFAGHDVYCATHRCFFSRLCVYVLVVKIEAEGDGMKRAIARAIDWLMSVCKAVPAGAQILVVGTWFRSQNSGSGDEALAINLEWLRAELDKADEERVKVWNEELQSRGPEGQAGERAGAKAERAEIVGACWVDCHSDWHHNLNAVRAKIVELAERTVQERQMFPQSYRATLDTHAEMAAASPTGIVSFESFRERVAPKLPFQTKVDERIRQALTFASEVGILQYYPELNADIIFLDPLFLVQTFGVAIYDEEAYQNHITGTGGKRYVYHGAVDGEWRRDLYERGIIRSDQAKSVWTFKDAGGIRDSMGGVDELVKALIGVMKRLDLVMEHSGPLETGGAERASGCHYLVPEVWSRRLQAPAGEERANARDDPSQYNPRQHLCVGIKVSVQGWLVPMFFRKFLCKCVNALREADDVWRNGSITQERDALRWVSSSWPVGPQSFVVWAEMRDGKQVLVKVAGLAGEMGAIRGLYLKVRGILEAMMRREHIRKEDEQFGIQRLSSGDQTQLDWGRRASLAREGHPEPSSGAERGADMSDPVVSYFLRDAPRDDDAVPNFNALHLIPRTRFDPEFLLHRRSWNAKAQRVARTVLVGGWGVSWALWRLRWSWEQLLTRPTTRARIRIEDLAADRDNSLAGEDHCLFVCHPLRNLYIPIRSWRARLVVDFCAEMMRLLGALRARTARITISSSARNVESVRAEVQAQGNGVGGSLNAEESSEVHVSIQRSWPEPVRPEQEGFGLDDMVWFFLEDSSGPKRTQFYGLDFGGAVDSLLNMKRQRVEHRATIGRNTVRVSSKKSAEFKVFAKVEKIGGVQAERSREEDLAFTLEYSARVFEWDAGRGRWRR